MEEQEEVVSIQPYLRRALISATRDPSIDDSIIQEEIDVRNLILESSPRLHLGGPEDSLLLADNDDTDADEIYRFVGIDTYRSPALFRLRIPGLNISMFPALVHLWTLFDAIFSLCSIVGFPQSPTLGWIIMVWVAAGVIIILAAYAAISLPRADKAVTMQRARDIHFHQNDAWHLLSAAIFYGVVGIMLIVWYVTPPSPKPLPIDPVVDIGLFLGQYGLNVVQAAGGLLLFCIFSMSNSWGSSGLALYYHEILVTIPAGTEAPPAPPPVAAAAAMNRKVAAGTPMRRLLASKKKSNK